MNVTCNRQYFLLALSGATLLVLVGMLCLIERPDASRASFHKEPHVYPLLITGLNATRYDGELASLNLRAQSLKITPRKFFVFSIIPFYDVTLTDAVVAIHVPGNQFIEPDIFSFPEMLLPPKEYRSLSNGSGFKMREIIKGLQLNIYREDTPILSIHAVTTIIDHQRKQAKFEHVLVKCIHSKKILRTKLIIWQKNRMGLKVPGKYSIISPNGKTIGEGTTVHWREL